MSAAERVAGVLAEHSDYEWWPMTREFICTCEASLGTSYPDAAHRAHLAAALESLIAEARAGALREAADDVQDECRHSSESCFCGSADWLRGRAAQIEAGDGCDCTELCSMGPTCPGGMLARLPGSGCWRTAGGDQ